MAAAPPPSTQIRLDVPEDAAAPEPPPSDLPPLAPPIEPLNPYQAPVYRAPAPRKHWMPVWLATVLSALAVVGLVAGVYYVVGYFHGGSSAKPTSAVESPGAKPGSAVNPIQKFIEVSSVRFAEDPKNKNKVVVRFVLTNHAETELDGLAGNVTIWASTGRSEEDAEGTFEFTTNLKPLESKELTAPLTGKKKIYELPDWQNMTNDVQITAPTS